MFKTVDLPKFILFFVMFYNDKPVDWLLDHFIQTKVCRFDKDVKDCKKRKQKFWIQHKQALFQHVGTHSSLKGKIQKLRIKGFGNMKQFTPHEDNPEATVSSTIKHYKKFSITDVYEGYNYFWGLNPVSGDLIDITFKKPANLEL